MKKIQQYWILIFFTISFQSTYAQDTSFRQLSLAYGISIDIPSHWHILSKDTRKNISAAGQAVVDNSGTEGISGKKRSLLAVDSIPSPTGAMIRVSVTSPPDYSQYDLMAATSTDLKQAQFELQKIFKQMEGSGGPKIIEMQAFRIEKLNKYRMLVMPYIRAGIRNSSPWQVLQYKIPVSNQLIEITLSYKTSDAYLWKPILERVKRSIRF